MGRGGRGGGDGPKAEARGDGADGGGGGVDVTGVDVTAEAAGRLPDPPLLSSSSHCGRGARPAGPGVPARSGPGGLPGRSASGLASSSPGRSTRSPSDWEEEATGGSCLPGPASSRSVRSAGSSRSGVLDGAASDAAAGLAPVAAVAFSPAPNPFPSAAAAAAFCPPPTFASSAAAAASAAAACPPRPKPPSAAAAAAIPPIPTPPLPAARRSTSAKL